jgi:hypothetical protein
MQNDNLPGLTPVWLITLATALGILITIAVPAILGPDGIKASDWLGFAGNVLTAGVAAVAVYFAWKGIANQLRVSLMSREEDRMERELPGLREIAALLRPASVLCSMKPIPKSAIRVLKSLGLQTTDGPILGKLEQKLPRADDGHRRPLAAILEQIALHAHTAITLEETLDAPVSEQERDLITQAVAEMTDAIHELSSFKTLIDDKIATFERRLPQFKAELSRFFEGR